MIPLPATITTLIILVALVLVAYALSGWHSRKRRRERQENIESLYDRSLHTEEPAARSPSIGRLLGSSSPPVPVDARPGATVEQAKAGVLVFSDRAEDGFPKKFSGAFGQLARHEVVGGAVGVLAFIDLFLVWTRDVFPACPGVPGIACGIVTSINAWNSNVTPSIVPITITLASLTTIGTIAARLRLGTTPSAKRRGFVLLSWWRVGIAGAATALAVREAVSPPDGLDAGIGAFAGVLLCSVLAFCAYLALRGRQRSDEKAELVARPPTEPVADGQRYDEKVTPSSPNASVPLQGLADWCVQRAGAVKSLNQNGSGLEAAVLRRAGAEAGSGRYLNVEEFLAHVDEEMRADQRLGGNGSLRAWKAVKDQAESLTVQRR